MTYQEIVNKAKLNLEKIDRQQRAEKEQEERKQVIAQKEYEDYAMNYIRSRIQSALLPFITVISKPNDYSTFYTINIPDCNQIICMVDGVGDLNFSTQAMPELIDSEEDEPYIHHPSKNTETNRLEIAIGYAAIHAEKEKEFNAILAARKKVLTQRTSPGTIVVYPGPDKIYRIGIVVDAINRENDQYAIADGALAFYDIQLETPTIKMMKDDFFELDPHHAQSIRARIKE